MGSIEAREALEAAAKEFVQRVLVGTFGQQTDDATINTVAAKVLKAVELSSR